MDDIGLGRVIRQLRQRRGWRQADLAERSGCAASTISLIERGHVDASAVGTLRRIAAKLDMRIDLVPRWRGGELDRFLNRGHAAMHEQFARHLAATPGWTMRPEVSFSVYGERGVIDVLGWHEERRILLVVELKTQLVDVMDLLSTMDRRRRLAPDIVEEFGWRPASVASLVLLTAGRTNRRRMTEHRTVLRAAFPVDGRRLEGWLRDPREPIAILTMWPATARRAATSPGRSSVARYSLEPRARQNRQGAGVTVRTPTIP